MTLDEAFKFTKTETKSELARWLGITRQSIQDWNHLEISLKSERDIKNKLSAIKAARASARYLKKENQLVASPSLNSINDGMEI